MDFVFLRNLILGFDPLDCLKGNFGLEFRCVLFHNPFSLT